MDKICMGFSDICKVNNDFIFIPRNFNVLCNLDALSGEVRELCNLDDDEIVRSESVDSIIKYDERLYIIPCYSNKIYIYDLETKKRIVYMYTNEKRYNLKSLYYKGKIWIIPTSVNDNIYMYDVNMCVCCEKVKLSDQIRGLVGEEDTAGFYPYLNDGIIYMAIMKTNVALQIDIKDEIVKKIEVPCKYKLRNVSWYEEVLWASLVDSEKVISYNCKTGEVVEYLPFDGIEEPIFISKICSFNDKMLVCSLKEIYILDEEEGVYKILGNDSCFREKEIRVYTDEEYMYVFYYDDDVIQIYNNKIKLVKTIEISEYSKKELYKDLIGKQLDSNASVNIYETRYGCTLEQILEQLKTAQKDKYVVRNVIGNTIWEEVKNSLI